MKDRVKEWLQMSAIAILLYYLYWCVAQVGFAGQLFGEHVLWRICSDVVVCLLLTWLSILYSRGIMHLMNGRTNVQQTVMMHTLALFVADILTAWGIIKLWNILFCESNILVYIQNIFVFGLLATLTSALKTNSLFWQKKLDLEREHARMAEEVVTAERVMTEAKLRNLQAQADPHFFFNNLSALSSLISTDTQTAKDFVAALASMYRHIHMGMKQTLVPLSEEMQLVKEYAKLLRIRYGENVIINIPDESRLPMPAYVPPVSIQHLVENAVKHNSMTASAPLEINITFENGRVCVSNNLNPLSGTEFHSGTGLSNLQEQLRLFGVDDPERHEDGRLFSISFQLIKQKPIS